MIHVIFEGMDLNWLRTIGEDGGTAHVGMIEILISLDLFKFKFRL
jgi:hypothetical protein